MRVDDIAVVLKENLEGLKISHASIRDPNNKEVSGHDGAVEAARKIRAAGVLIAACDKVLSYKVFSVNVESRSVVANNQIASEFRQAVNTLREQAYHVLIALTDILEETPKATLRVSLPSNASLGELASLFGDLERFLSQVVVNEHLNGQVKVVRFASGSFWLDIFLGTLAAYNFLGGLTDLYFRVHQKKNQLKAQSRMLDGLEVDVDHRKAVQEAILQQIDKLTADNLEELFSEHEIPKEDAEYRVRVKKSIGFLHQLLARGVQLHDSLALVEDGRPLFPDPSEILETIRSLPEASTDRVSMENSEG